MTDELIFGESIALDSDTQATPIVFRGVEVGQIRSPQEQNTGFHIWDPSEGMQQTGLQLPSMAAFSRSALVDTLQGLVERQVDLLDAGKPLTAEALDPLDPELQDYKEELAIGPVLRHPLVYQVPYFPQMAPDANGRFWQIQKALEDARSEGNWSGYISMHERPYRLQALLDISENYDLTDEEYWELVAHFWIDSENIHQNASQWRELWMGRDEPHLAMDSDDLAFLLTLPDVVTIYRGFRDVEHQNGMSWTLDRDKAIWFANRYRRDDRDAYLATAKVRRHDILAYFSGRNEQEIVVYPEKLFEVERTTVSRRKRGT